MFGRKILNIFVTPLRLSEFFIASVILGIIKIIITCAILFIITLGLYHYNIFSIGISLIPYLFNLFLFGMVIALFINGVIVRYGTSAQVLAFGLIFIIQPICAVFYPVSALPTFIHPLSYAIPVTHVFESMRATIAGAPFDWQSFFVTTILNVIYFILAWLFFKKMFANVKKKGLLLKVQN